MRIEIVLSAVDLDDEAMLYADEINNVTVTWRLSPEVKAT
jgi:hypothetical protein